MRFRSSPGNPARRPRWAIVAAVACGFVSAASAQQADKNPLNNPFKSVMKVLGFAADPPEAQDFVVKSRPEKEPDYIPVFEPPPEPARPVLKGKELDDLKGDLDSVEKRADAARAGFPPAADAAAEQKTPAAKGKTTPKAANP